MSTRSEDDEEARDEEATSDKHLLRRVVGGAAGNPVNLLVAAVSIMAALILGTWWMLVVGFAVYSGLVAWNTLSPAFWRKTLAGTRPPQQRLPDPATLADGTLRSMVASIKAGRASVSRVLAKTPGDVKTQLRFALGSLDELEACAARLVARADVLGRYLATVNRDSIRGEIGRLDELLRRAGDPEAQREYGLARAARQEQLGALDDVARAHERASAGLLRVVAAVEALPSRIVRVRVLDAQARDDLYAELEDQLDRMNGEMLTSERSLAALLPGAEGYVSDEAEVPSAPPLGGFKPLRA